MLSMNFWTCTSAISPSCHHEELHSGCGSTLQSSLIGEDAQWEPGAFPVPVPHLVRCLITINFIMWHSRNVCVDKPNIFKRHISREHAAQHLTADWPCTPQQSRSHKTPVFPFCASENFFRGARQAWPPEDYETAKSRTGLASWSASHTHDFPFHT